MLPPPRLTQTSFSHRRRGNPLRDSFRRDEHGERTTRPWVSADKASNKADKLAGKAKEKIGRPTGNQRMEDEGRADRVKARLKEAGENIKDAFRR